MGELVCVGIYLNRMEAETNKSFLEANGITTILTTDDADAMEPELTFANGTKILVASKDAQEALSLLQKNKGTSEQKSDPWFEEKRKEAKRGAARLAPHCLFIWVTTLLVAIVIFLSGAGENLKSLAILLAFISFVFWGVWLSAILSKRELKKKDS